MRTKLRDNLNAKHLTIFKAAKAIKTPYMVFYQALMRFERGGKPYLSSRLMFSRALGITTKQFERDYVN